MERKDRNMHCVACPLMIILSLSLSLSLSLCESEESTSKMQERVHQSEDSALGERSEKQRSFHRRVGRCCVCTLTLTVQDRPRHPAFLPARRTTGKHSRPLVLCKSDSSHFRICMPNRFLRRISLRTLRRLRAALLSEYVRRSKYDQEGTGMTIYGYGCPEIATSEHLRCNGTGLKLSDTLCRRTSNMH